MNSSSVTSRHGGARAYPTSPARSASTSRSFQFSVSSGTSSNNNRGRSSSNPRAVQNAQSGSFPPNIHPPHNRDDLNNLVDDEELKRFKTTIEESPVDEWRTRTTSLELLIASVPEVRQNFQTVVPKWYQSSQAVARLSNPLSSLILDARSTVVKHACHHILILVRRCNLHNPPSSDVCRYLLRDLTPSILNLSAQTVNVIRNYAVDMMCKLIPMCRFKSGLPMILDRLRSDKSRDVREACVRYLKLVLQHWFGTHANPSDSDLHSQPQPYLSKENCMHVGKTLAYALSDPSQTVRMEARQSFEVFRGWYPDLWSEILHDPDGIFAKDMKLKKNLIDSAARFDAENGGSYSNYDRDDSTVGTFESRNGESLRSSSVLRQDGVSNRVGPATRSDGTVGSYESRNGDNVRSSSALRQDVSTTRVGPATRPVTGIRGPPLRTTDNSFSKLPPKADLLKGSTPRASQYTGILSIPTNDALVVQKSESSDRRDSGHRKYLMSKKAKEKAARTIQAAFRGYLSRTFINSTYTESQSLASILDRPSRSKPTFLGTLSVGSSHHKKVFSGDDSIGSIMSPLQLSTLDDHGISVSVTSLDREMDNRLKSRNSSMLLIKRLQKCGTPTSVQKHDSAITDQHIIASQLLAAHKAYIDEFMECLQSEMKLIKKFEELMKSSHSSNGNRPSEEDVISYFESVYQLLDKETHNSNTLRSALVRISQGSPM